MVEVIAILRTSGCWSSLHAGSLVLYKDVEREMGTPAIFALSCLLLGERNILPYVSPSPIFWRMVLIHLLRPIVILLDVREPSMDGHIACRQ
jgi:CheY-like chemotaxis protein